MQTFGPEKRYGKALFDLAREAKKVDALFEETQALAKMLGESDGFRALLADPRTDNSTKENVLVDVLKKAKASELFTHFCQLVAQKGRCEYLAAMLACFETFYLAHSNTVVAYVRSAQALTDAQRKDIEAFVKAQSKGAKNAQLQEEIDAELMAGLTVRIGSVQHDVSVKGRLDALKNAMSKV